MPPQNVSFYPSHSTPTLPAHSHWLITDGEDPPPIEIVIDQIRDVATALRQPSIAAEYPAFWFDREVFAKCVLYLVTYFGYEDPRVEVPKDTIGSQGVDRWILDTVELSRATGIVWPAWGVWRDELVNGMEAMTGACIAADKEVPKWYDIWWTQGHEARLYNGYRIREIPELDGQTHYDTFVDSLEKNEERLALADEWAQRLSESALLSELVAAGVVDVPQSVSLCAARPCHLADLHRTLQSRSIHTSSRFGKPHSFVELTSSKWKRVIMFSRR
jgi:hypothetical protein